MKQILLLTAFLLASAAVSAQGLEFKYKGESLTDGATITIAAEEDFFGELSCETNPSTAPQDGLVLSCPASFGGTVIATLQILSNTLNASTMQWCMGGECTLVRQEQLSKTFDSKASILVLFDATNITGEGTLMAKLSVQFNGSTRTVYIQFVNGDADGINSIKNEKIKDKSGVYDLSGRKINVQCSMFNVQSNKLHIQNGKKFYKQ